MACCGMHTVESYETVSDRGEKWRKKLNNSMHGHGQTMEDCTSTDNFPYPATTFNFVTHFYVTQFDFEDNDTISYLLL